MNKTVVFDLDGTIYFGENIATEALISIKNLIENNFNILFLTNNSTKTRTQIKTKLNSLGVKTDESKIYSSSYATAKYLFEQNINDVFVIGSDGLKSEINDLGINCSDENNCQAIVVGLDLEFNYQTISKALVALNRNVKFIVCNIDKFFPVENQMLKPACNAMVGALIGTSGRDIDFIVGKPNFYLLDIICRDWKLRKEDIWVVGDSLESDIAMADSFGCKSVLVGNKGITTEVVDTIIGRSM